MKGQAATLSVADFSISDASGVGTIGGRNYIDPDYHWSFRLPDNWAGQYLVIRRQEQDGVYWRFYHLQSWLAGYERCILDYDPATSQTYPELTVSPVLSFYPNGFLKVSSTQNQTDGSLWPYHLYQYQSDTDTYESVCLVYSCDKEILESLDRGDEYPQEADKSNSGIVYYVNSTVPMDQEDYRLWERSWTEGGDPLSLDELPLTEENIASLVS